MKRLEDIWAEQFLNEKATDIATDWTEEEYQIACTAFLNVSGCTTLHRLKRAVAAVRREREKKLASNPDKP